uniref:Polyhomeotic-like protein 2 n=5 Tax=Lygus hesperus TaxID=30085 RepID=A0A0K8SKB4_LYGHE
MIGEIPGMDSQVQQQGQQLMHQQQMQQQQQQNQQQDVQQQQVQVQSNQSNQQAMEIQQQVQNSQQQQAQQQVQNSQQQQAQQIQQQVQQVQQQVQQQQPMLLVNAGGGQQQMQVTMSTPQSSMCTMSANTISTMQAQGSITQPVQAATGQSQMQVTDWNGRQVQVLQQPVQNTAYVQQVAYNANGQLIMPGNIQLHPNQSINPGSIQVIAAGKPFGQNQIASHVIGKPVLNQQNSFPSYATIPTTNNQALLISQIATGVISSQPSILPAHSGAGGQQKPELQKIKPIQGVSGAQIKAGGQGANVQSSMALSGCVVSQPTMLHHLISPIQYTTCQNRGIQSNNQVQLSPWQFDTSQIPQVWTQHPHQVITAQNPIFIRGPHQDQPMFIQSPPPQQSIQQQQQQQALSVAKPELKAQTGQTQQGTRTLSILPSMSSAQLTRGPNPTVVLSAQIKLAQSKTVRTKSIVTKGTSIQKLDAQNQTKPISPQPNAQHPPGTKMIITSQGTLMPQQQLLQPKPPPLMNIAPGQTLQVQSQPPKDMPIVSDEIKMDTTPALQAQAPVEVPQIPQVVALQPPQENGVCAAPVPQVMEVSQTMVPIATPAVAPTVAVPTPLPTPLALPTPVSVAAPITPQPQQMMVPPSEPMQVSSAEATPVAPVQPTTAPSPAPAPTAPAPDPPKPPQGPPKAMVKPQVLTHVIEGYVIQESSEPFPISRSSLLSELAQTVRARKDKTDNNMAIGADEPPLKKQNLEAAKTPGAVTGISPTKKRTKCDICGGPLPEGDKSKKNKKYCSPECTKKGKLRKKGQLIEDKDKADRTWDAMESTSDSAVSGPESLGSDAGENPVAAAISRLDEDLKDLPTPNPLKWTVSTIRIGCCGYEELSRVYLILQ